jgi:hypothetical protein
LLEVGQQRGDRLIRLLRQAAMVGFDDRIAVAANWAANGAAVNRGGPPYNGPVT